MSEKQINNIFNIDVDIRFQSFNILKMAEAIDGEYFGFPGCEILIISMRAEQIDINSFVYSYEAKVTKYANP